MVTAASLDAPEAAVASLRSAPGRTLVLGLGNDLLRDDRIGLLVVEAVHDRLRHAPAVDVSQSLEMGLALLDSIVGFDALVLVDAVQTGAAAPGTLHELDVGDLKVLPRLASPHFLGVGEVLQLGELLGLSMPRRVRVLAVEVEDPFTLALDLTPGVARALAPAADRILAILKSWELADGAQSDVTAHAH